MSDLSIIVCSVLGFLVYIQIGRFLGWWSYRTFHAHLQYQKLAWVSYAEAEQDRARSLYFNTLREYPTLGMRILFPVISFRWGRGTEEVVTSAAMDILHSPRKGSEDFYRYLMCAFWPAKVLWCLGVWFVIGVIASFRLLFSWPKQKVAKSKPQDAKKSVAEEHRIN